MKVVHINTTGSTKKQACKFVKLYAAHTALATAIISQLPHFTGFIA